MACVSSQIRDVFPFGDTEAVARCPSHKKHADQARVYSRVRNKSPSSVPGASARATSDAHAAGAAPIRCSPAAASLVIATPESQACLCPIGARGVINRIRIASLGSLGIDIYLRYPRKRTAEIFSKKGAARGP